MGILDIAQMTTATTGTGTIQLGSNTSGYQTFASAGATNNQVFSYGITDTGFAWEVGRGTYITNTSGNFMARTTILYATNTTPGPINLSGSAVVYATFLDYDYNTFSPSNSVNIGSNVIINTTSLFFGNSTANTFGNSTIDIFANASGQTVITPTTLVVANSTASAQVGIGTFSLQGTGSNTGLTVGTSSIAANGYSFLTNGLLLEWGIANCNSTVTSITFPIKFPTGVFSVVLTANSIATINAYARLVNANSSVFAMITGNATNVSVTWIATGH